MTEVELIITKRIKEICGAYSVGTSPAQMNSYAARILYDDGLDAHLVRVLYKQPDGSIENGPWVIVVRDIGAWSITKTEENKWEVDTYEINGRSKG